MDNKVVIISSPYSSVRVGTIATVSRSWKKREFTESGKFIVYTMYEFDELPHKIFYKSETQEVK